MTKKSKPVITIERDDLFQFTNEILDNMVQRQLPIIEAIARADERRYSVQNDLANTVIKISTVFLSVSFPGLLAVLSLDDTSVFNHENLLVSLGVVIVLGLSGLIWGYKQKREIEDSINKDYIAHMPALTSIFETAGIFNKDRVQEVRDAIERARADSKK